VKLGNGPLYSSSVDKIVEKILGWWFYTINKLQNNAIIKKNEILCLMM